MRSLKDLKLCIIGMGYVGLPLAVEFGKIRSVWGFDTNHERIRRLIKGEDTTFEITRQELKLATKLKLTSAWFNGKLLGNHQKLLDFHPEPQTLFYLSLVLNHHSE